MKLSKRVLYPIDEIYMYESDAMRAATWESASDVVHPALACRASRSMLLSLLVTPSTRAS